MSGRWLKSGWSRRRWASSATDQRPRVERFVLPRPNAERPIAAGERLCPAGELRVGSGGPRFREIAAVPHKLTILALAVLAGSASASAQVHIGAALIEKAAIPATIDKTTQAED